MAVEMLQEKHYDLLLLDIQMPVMDGYSTATHIREVMKSGIPIVAMTAHIMVDASVCAGDVVAAEIERQFANAQVAYLHLHNAKQGCYSCRVDRVTCA